MRLEKYGKFWKLSDSNGNIIAVIVYKKGALEVMRRLGEKNTGKHNETTRESEHMPNKMR